MARGPEEPEVSGDGNERAGHRARLRERFLAAPDVVPDYELLELLLFAAHPRGDVKPLAKRLLAHFGGLPGVLNADPDRLGDVDGGETAPVRAIVRAVREAALRLARAEVIDRPAISSWQQLIDYCQIAFGHATAEEFRVLFLDRKNRLMRDEPQARGTVDHAPVYPREVVRRALELGASAIILVHNHPSGDPTPSRADVEMTKAVREAARAVGVTLHDHLVIGRGRHASFKSLGLL